MARLILMLPADHRNLLPPIAAFPEDIIGPELPFEGSVLPPSNVPLVCYPPNRQPHDSLAWPERNGDGPDDHDVNVGGIAPLKGHEIGSGSPHYSATLVRSPEGHFAPAKLVEHASANHAPAKHALVGHKGDDGGNGHSGEPSGHHGGEPSGQHGGDLSGQDGGKASAGEGPSASVSGGPTSVDAGQGHAVSDDPLAETDDGSSITVTQLAIVDQDAGILVSGYIGEVVAVVHIDQDLFMDQDVNIDFTIDGDGHFNIVLDQAVRIEQDVQIDLKIWDDNDGVLHVELYLHDTIEVDQDTDVYMKISDGPPGGSVEINQDVELVQNIDIDVDIEDDLEERYLVNVQVGTLQDADVDQDAVVGVKDLNGHTDVDLNAIQTAAVEQQTFVHADFVLV